MTQSDAFFTGSIPDKLKRGDRDGKAVLSGDMWIREPTKEALPLLGRDRDDRG